MLYVYDSMVVGAVCWVVDYHYCLCLINLRGRPVDPGASLWRRLLQSNPLTQFHAVWHVCSGYGGYVQVLIFLNTL